LDIDLRIVIEKVLNHVYAIGKSNIMLTWEYIVVLNIKGKHNLKQLLYTHYSNTYQQGSKLLHI